MLSLSCLKYPNVTLGRQTSNLEFRWEIRARGMDVGGVLGDLVIWQGFLRWSSVLNLHCPIMLEE